MGHLAGVSLFHDTALHDHSSWERSEQQFGNAFKSFY
jgi:hypothetical protein